MEASKAFKFWEATFAREELRGDGVLVGSEAMHSDIDESKLSCGWMRGKCAMISMSNNVVVTVAEFFEVWMGAMAKEVWPRVTTFVECMHSWHVLWEYFLGHFVFAVIPMHLYLSCRTCMICAYVTSLVSHKELAIWREYYFL